MAIAKLSIDLEIRLAKIEAGLQQATRAVEKSATDIEQRYAKVGNSLKTLGGAIAAAFSVSVLRQFFTATLDGLDALVDLRDATGASVENLSALEDVARRTGTSVDGMASTLVKFNKVLSEGKAGSETANILKSIGLDAEKLKAIDPAEALRQTAVALAKYADDGSKARIVQALFGKSIQEAGPYLAELAKQGKLNATVTTEQAEAAEKFKNELNAISKIATDVARALAGPLVTSLNKVATALKNYSTVWDAFKDNFRFDVSDDIGGNLAKTFTELAEARAKLAQVNAEAAKESGIGPERGRFTAERKDLEQQIRLLEGRERFLRAVAPDPTGGPTELARRGRGVLAAPDVSGIAADKTPKAEQLTEAQRALAAYIDKLESERQKVAEISAEERALNFLKEIGTTGQIPQVRELVLGLAAELDQRTDLEAMLKLQTKAQDELNAAEERRSAKLRDLVSQTPTGKLLEQRVQMEELADAYKRGEFGIVGTTKAMELFGETVNVALGNVAEKLDDVNTFAEEAGRNIQDALGDTLLATLKGDFESIGRLWGNMIQRMIAEALAANLGKALLGDFAKTGNIGGWLGSLFGGVALAKGGAFVNGVQAFASGGVVTSPRLFPFAGGAGLMGEAGPEAIMPLRRGRDGKLGVSSDGGGVTIINNVATGVTRNEALVAMQMIANSLRGEFKQMLRTAGVI